jgi:hypothetical protein
MQVRSWWCHVEVMYLGCVVVCYVVLWLLFGVGACTRWVVLCTILSYCRWIYEVG